MRILAYDTSGDRLTAALAEDGRLVCEIESAPDQRHSSTLVPLLEKILKKARWKPKDLDVLAVGVGPGSFTGLRVGVMTAKALSLVWKTKLLGVSSLEAIAWASVVRAGRLAVAVDARRGRIYAALYERDGGRLIERIAPALTTPEVFFKKAGGPVEILERPFVRASNVARAALEHARRRRFMTADSLEPLYLQPRDCNVTKKQ